jgi:uncharacterized tellurite resistance protein B-like protein
MVDDTLTFTSMEGNEKILQGHSDAEKGAYLGAIASIATADRTASADEIEYLSRLCDAADLSDQQKQSVGKAATEVPGKELTRCLDILKNSELKYPLITDLMAFAKADQDFSEEEEESIHRIAEYLGVDQHQLSLLDQFTEKTTTANITPQQAADPGFLSSLGLKDKLQNAGINGSSLLKGLIAVAAPMILSNALSRRSTTTSSGGLGGMFGGGGLGSLIGMLSGGRGLGNTGGLLGRILGRGCF